MSSGLIPRASKMTTGGSQWNTLYRMPGWEMSLKNTITSYILMGGRRCGTAGPTNSQGIVDASGTPESTGEGRQSNQQPGHCRCIRDAGVYRHHGRAADFFGGVTT
ncbi:hypothetical protein TNCV_822731 [Trichonephila clavipes]|nr:hypothetical protein TNCV_822731 [Trichonephila clavipes]